MNSWDDPGFRAAIEATGKKNILLCGLWTEVCVTWPAIEMLGAPDITFTSLKIVAGQLPRLLRKLLCREWCKRARSV